VTVSDPAGGFSFQIPASWQVSGPCQYGPQAPGNPPIYEVNVQPMAYDLQFACGTDFVENIQAESYAGSAPDDTYLTESSCTTSSAVTVGGVEGTRYQEDGACLESGNATVTEYVFITGGQVFEIYDQQNQAGARGSSGPGSPTAPADPDLSAMLDMIVTHTWQFHS
jgi:hypothetical protein